MYNCPLHFSSSDLSKEHSFDLLSRLGVDRLVKESHSPVKTVTGSNKYQKAYHIHRLTLLRMPTQKIFWQMVPSQFSFSTTFRVSKDNLESSWNILYLEDSDGRMQLGVQLSEKKRVIKLKLLNTAKMSIQNIDFSLDNIYFSNFFDGDWHKLGVSLTPSRIEVFVDCVKVGSAYPRNNNLSHIDTQGVLYMGRKTDGHGVEFDLQWAMLHCDPKVPSLEKCFDINIKAKTNELLKLPHATQDYEDEDLDEGEKKYLEKRKKKINKKILEKIHKRHLEKNKVSHRRRDFYNDDDRHSKNKGVTKKPSKDKKIKIIKVRKIKKPTHKSVQKFLEKKSKKKKIVKKKAPKVPMKPLEQGMSLAQLYQPPSPYPQLSHHHPSHHQPSHHHPSHHHLSHHHSSHHQPSHHQPSHHQPSHHHQPPSSFNPYQRTQAMYNSYNGDIDSRMVSDSNYFDHQPSLRGEPGYRDYAERLYQLGAHGPPGLAGRTGASGSPGPRGLSGEPGIPGSSGNPGAPGQPGSQGIQGIQGLRGQPGMPGVPGPAARMHTTTEVKEICTYVLQERMMELSYTMKGPPGPPGMGNPGKQGSTGKQGIPGDPGIPGIQGERGMYGPMGPPGNNGLPGSKGDNGERGEAGECDSYDTPNEGGPGPPGPQGQTGVGNPGSQGIRGETGMPGQPGSNGDRGIRGPPGVCNCQDYMHPFGQQYEQTRRKRSLRGLSGG